MLVCSRIASIDEQPFHIRVLNSSLKDFEPFPLCRPGVELLEDGVPLPKFAGQITSGTSDTNRVKHSLDKETQIRLVVDVNLAENSGQLQPVPVSEHGTRHLQIRGGAGVVTAISADFQTHFKIFDETSTVPGKCLLSDQLLMRPTRFFSKHERSHKPIPFSKAIDHTENWLFLV